MRKVIAVFTALSFLVLPVPANAALPKAGATCTKINQSQNVNGYKFTCLKSGKKLVWKKLGVVAQTPSTQRVDFSKTYSTDHGYKTLFFGPCDFDMNIPAELVAVQKYFYDFTRCAGQLQLGKYSLGSKRPTKPFDSASKFSNFEPCKLTTPENLRSNMGYQLAHHSNSNTPSHVQFNKDLVAAVDPLIDFKGANMAIIVPPPGTESSVFSQAAIGALQTNEGRVTNVMTEFPALGKNPQDNSFTLLGHPFWWVHEIMHAGVGFEDHYGDTKKDLTTEYGMGHLTLMTPWGGDLTTWEKVRLNFMHESQFQCKSDSATSTHWIAPSTVQTQESKAVVIPISSTKVVVIETLRPGGLFYKHPLESQGVIAYEIDLTQEGHGLGMKLSLPIGRPIERSELFMASAPLKLGESTINNGYKITVVESGTFGDVIKVEKV